MRIFCRGVALALSVTAACAAGDPEVKTDFRIVERGGRSAVEVLAGKTLLLTSPAEGLWSVATDWRDGWPAEWRHAAPRQVSQAGPWTILEGSIETEKGAWRLRDAYRERGRAVECVRRWQWTGKTRAEKTTLAVRWRAPKAKGQILLPGIVYYGNPSGARSQRTPVFSPDAPLAIFEEHRYPLPFASLEWVSGKRRVGAALHSLPSPVPCGNLPDQWWSLGADASADSTELVLLSGPCASNGRQSVVKAVQPGFLPYDEAWLELEPGAVIEKTFRLEVYPVEREGSGFRRPLWTSLDLFRPEQVEEFPTFGAILEAKYRFARQRWHEADGASGFKKYPDRPFFVIGWCGQAAAPGYALQVLADRLGDPGALAMAQRSLDFLSTAEFYEGGFHTWYNYEEKRWSHDEPLSQGQGMLNFARAVRAGRKSGRDTSRWEAFLARASDFHAQRILRDDWRPRSTDEGFFIAPLSLAAELFGSELCRRAAIRAAEHYAERHLQMREPYWGGTLDAKCEDKEGAYAAFQGFLAVYALTGEDRFLQWARHACDVVLTYLVAWDIDLPAGRLRNHAFKTRGWTVVSPQNQHIDAYGVLIAPDVYRLGQILQDDRLKRLGLLMFRSCGQLLDPYGSHGEQPQHTNYAQRGRVESVFGLRGGYVEDWTVFWLTAHFLNAAARFEELGGVDGQ
ncbi:MAG: hypothetical protein GXY25_20245 [Pirellulaceae bacterium]|jgi:hypothetical protein|nr:hypothetical protein [Thermoguttaceae bacterium]MDI9446255.1 hypothetical protein [Planctomycetota bacterium]NLZ02857.1 hypothetical protein [Pirellulaceae bacterium]